MPSGRTRRVKERIKMLEEYIKNTKCVTITSAANVLKSDWETARNTLNELAKDGKAVRHNYAGKMLYCASEKDAFEVVHRFRRELWRLVCKSRRRYISPSAVFKMIINDKQARKFFSKYIIIDRLNSGALSFIARMLEDVLKTEPDWRNNKALYAVSASICNAPPAQPESLPRYYRKNLTTVHVTERMAKDLELAAKMLNVSKSKLVRMAVEKMLNEYRHLLGR
jgi:hypothetical protein